MRLFSTDIDGTIYDGPESAALFSKYWTSLRSAGSTPLLVYNTGRAIDETKRLVEETDLPEPDFLICGVGTVIHQVSDSENFEEWGEHLEQDWNFDLVWEVVEEHGEPRPQPDHCQNRHKCSWYWDNAEPENLERLVGLIEARGIRVQAIYSSNRDLDFLPVRANKGNALAWLGERVGIGNEAIVVAGDSGNDASMYEVEAVRGILVANAELALVESVRKISPYHASQPCAAGVIEGLDYHRRPIESASGNEV
ncbi:MAG: HAD-IIB family hydrolase [Verrucomicrobiae bacterium]|nr:HAD-IIB family hydrolase [Verrucomicrobiae bacterium]